MLISSGGVSPDNLSKAASRASVKLKSLPEASGKSLTAFSACGSVLSGTYATEDSVCVSILQVVLRVCFA